MTPGIPSNICMVIARIMYARSVAEVLHNVNVPILFVTNAIYHPYVVISEETVTA